MTVMEANIISAINNGIGHDSKQLHNAAILLNRYRSLIEEGQEHGQDLTSKIESALQSQSISIQALDLRIKKVEEFDGKLSINVENTHKAYVSVVSELRNVCMLQQLNQYSKIVQDIQEISESLTSAIQGKDETKMVNIYLTLFEDNDCENSVLGRLKDVQAYHLKLFATKTASYWHKLLKDKFLSELESALKVMRWGFKECDSLTFSPSRDNITKAQLLAEYLFLIKTPVEEQEPLDVITPSIICQPVDDITRLLLAPYRQRFQYHFNGIRQTNRLDKPEWFFTQVLNWGKQVNVFVGKTFQSSAMKAGKLNYNIRLEFIRGLVQLIIEKLSADIEEISQDELLFAHLLDETFAFEAELRVTFGYPSSYPSAMCIVTQPLYLLKWISLEERFCSEKMDFILQGENPWILIGEKFYDNELKIPKCADQFIRLLEAIKDRYYSLIQPGHQLQFLSLQLELIENFRRRLAQLHSCGKVDSISILNAINYLALVLREWGENVHYLHLHVALVGPNSTEVHTVFDQTISELELWTQKLIESLASKALNEIKAKSMLYRHDCWSSMPEQNCSEPLILSPSAGEMFQVMVTTFHNMDRQLSFNLFKLILRIIAYRMDEFLFESLIMNNKFTPGAAAQLNYDMSRNLFALFGQYCRKPELLFKRVHEASKLLNSTRGTALLLYEVLLTGKMLEQKLDAMKELGIVSFKYQTCIEVLERRIDLKPL